MNHAHWITTETTELFVVFKNNFSLKKEISTSLTVTADQRYILYCDGKRIGRGPERGDIDNWYAEKYELMLPAGDHIITALVWCLPMDKRPHAQISRDKLALLISADKAHAGILSTGIADWQYRKLEGISFEHPAMLNMAQGMTGRNFVIKGRDFHSELIHGGGSDWEKAHNAGEMQTIRDSAHYGLLYTPKITNATLLPQLDKAIDFSDFSVRAVDNCKPTKESPLVKIADPQDDEKCTLWTKTLQNKLIRIAPNTSIRFIIDMNQYYCGYPELKVSGGKNSIIRLGWAESLFDEPETEIKGHRDQVSGKYFKGKTDIFLPSGKGDEFFTFWWKAGRYLELCIETREESLCIEQFDIYESRYPLEMEVNISVDHRGFMRALPVMWRTLQMCSHETYMDCPYYEQLQYIGDTRLQILVTYMTANDDRLPKKAINIIAASQHPSGMLMAHYPSSTPQIIPQFSLYWIGMLYDFALWRGDENFVKSHLYTMRSILEAFITKQRDDGLVQWPEGWDWNDWPEAWQHNSSEEKPTDFNGLCSVNQFLLIYIAGLAIEIEEWIGEKNVANRLKIFRDKLLSATRKTFWCDKTKAFALGDTKKTFAEHTQCFAVLSGMLNDNELAGIKDNLLHNPNMQRATIYFKHYLFETYYALNCTEQIVKQLDFWTELVDRGFKTTIEAPEPSRSDCHAWGAHPIYHLYASLLGTRPAALGNRQLIQNPKPGGLKHIEAEMATGKDIIKLKL